MNSFKAWFQAHSSAILASVIVVSKAGLLGKVASTIVTAIAAAVAS